ncbi:hypothetical protein [Natronomonas amylolytica]|uniref:hypothetical protein n=1 Tax=Natronomonas amylolytica TaxID=3108498 RepID=UPI003009C080
MIPDRIDEEPTTKHQRHQHRPMRTPANTNRRTVLRGIGTSLVGGTVLTGSTVAARGGRTDIYLRGHNFTPNKAHVRLGGEGGSATVRWINDEGNYGSEELPVPHDVHLHHHHEGNLVKSGIFTQMNSYDPDGDGPTPTVPLGPTFYEVKFREEGSDLVIEETAGMVKSPPLEDIPPIYVIEEYETARIEDWGGAVTLDVHCSIHSLLLDVNEGEVVTQRIQSDETEPPYEHHAGFLKMDGGLTVTQ